MIIFVFLVYGRANGPASGRASDTTTGLRAGRGHTFCGPGRPGPHNSLCGPGPGRVCTTAAGPGRAWASNHLVYGHHLIRVPYTIKFHHMFLMPASFAVGPLYRFPASHFVTNHYFRSGKSRMSIVYVQWVFLSHPSISWMRWPSCPIYPRLSWHKLFAEIKVASSELGVVCSTSPSNGLCCVSCLTTIDIDKHGTCTAPHRQTTQDTKRIIIRYNKPGHASLSIGDP